jgi:hypothetical protein
VIFLDQSSLIDEEHHQNLREHQQYGEMTEACLVSLHHTYLQNLVEESQDDADVLQHFLFEKKKIKKKKVKKKKVKKKKLKTIVLNIIQNKKKNRVKRGFQKNIDRTVKRY